MQVVAEQETCVETKSGGGAKPPRALVASTPDQGEFRFHRRVNVHLFMHSEGVAILDKSGAVTVIDAALVCAAYDVLMHDRRPPVRDAVEVLR